MTYQKYQTPTNQACPKSQNTCSTFGTSKLTHIISPFPSKRISTTTPKVKESPWLSEDSANTDISIDSDRDSRKKNTNVCVTSAEPEFTLKHEALKKFLWEYSHLWRMLIIPIPCFSSYFSLSYTSITWPNHYRTQKPILSWFETRRKTQATFFRCNIPRASCQWETRVTQLQYQYLWQKVMNVSTRKFCTLVDSWLGKHITFPVVLNTDIISKYSSSKAWNIWPVYCTVYKCLPFPTFDDVPCLHSVSYSYWWCASLVPKMLIGTDDMPHLYCIPLLTLHILHIGCT